ncbi:PD40 domain-containing protein [bacterium]|nr:PD40 domain-containing protein [bacterium]
MKVSARFNPRHRRSLRLILLAACSCLALGLANAGRAQADELPQAMLRSPDISAGQVAFIYANDIWIAPKEGGAAQRLTSAAGAEGAPRFSPDGGRLAFSAAYDGNQDVYELPVAGGIPRRLTVQPFGARVLDYSPDGRVCFATSDISTDETTLWFADPAGGLPERLSLKFGDMASFSADGSWVAFTPWRHIWQDDSWHRYQGGQAADIWTFNLGTLESRQITSWAGTDDLPMASGERIFYLSDAGPEGRRNIWVYDLASETHSQVTHFADAELRWPAIGPEDIVFQQGGKLWRMPLATLTPQELRISLSGDRPYARPETLVLEGEPDRSCLSPQGRRLAIEKRGDIWTIPAREGYPVCLTPSDGVAERDPAWSPDGRWIAYISDSGRERYEVFLRAADGSGEARQLSQGSEYRMQHLRWSPDSRWIAYEDVQGHYYVLDAQKGGQKLLATDPYNYTHGPLHWSPDSRWVTYELLDEKSTNPVIWITEVQSGKAQQVTDSAFPAGSPCFDLSGRWLFFSSRQDLSPLYGDVDDYDVFLFANSTRLAALPLRRDVKSPFLPRSDEEKPAPEAGAEEAGAKPEAKADASQDAKESAKATAKGKAGGPEAEEAAGPPPVEIDFEGIRARAIGLPLLAGNFHTLEGGHERLYYVQTPRTGALPAAGDLKVFDLAAAAAGEDGAGGMEDYGGEEEGAEEEEEEQSFPRGRYKPGVPGMESNFDYTLIPGVDGYQITPDGQKLLVYAMGEMFVTGAELGAALDKPVPLPALRKEINPYHEWEQMIWEVWRAFREEFWDPGLHGVDWNAARDRALALLPYCASNEDIGFVISEMVGELNSGHTYVSPTPSDYANFGGVGMLGCDFERAQDSAGKSGIRISRVYRGHPAELDMRGPLDEPGVDIKAGEFLQAVNGVAVDPARSPYYYLQGQGGRTLRLKVGPQAAADEQSREVLVTARGYDGNLRHYDWVEKNRQYVLEKSGGRVGYIHVTDTGDWGIADLMRQFLGQHNMDALIIDERYNHGGNIAHRFIELLDRPVVEYDMTRDGKPVTFPQRTAQGAKVMLVNQYAGSGGDGFPWLFRKRGLGKVIGVRTWGGWIGIGGREPLLNGTWYSVPGWYGYEPDGTWMIEGYGVDPDIVVVNDPTSTSKGLDPQLDKAIEVALAEADANPVRIPPVPTYPDRSGRGVKPEDR